MGQTPLFDKQTMEMMIAGPKRRVDHSMSALFGLVQLRSWVWAAVIGRWHLRAGRLGGALFGSRCSCCLCVLSGFGLRVSAGGFARRNSRAAMNSAGGRRLIHMLPTTEVGRLFRRGIIRTGTSRSLRYAEYAMAARHRVLNAGRITSSSC